MTPSEIWSAALADKLVIPRLQITALSNTVALSLMPRLSVSQTLKQKQQMVKKIKRQ
jgi:hypothetical protein